MGHVIVECDGCKKQHTIQEADLDIDQVGSDEREMGPEEFYEGAIDFDCDCGRSISVVHEYSEYPVGMPQDGATRAVGATIKQNTL